MAEYQFVTRWEFDAPVDAVWNLITDTLRWPEWWRGVIAVTPVSPGNSEGIGEVRRYTWKSALPYSLAFNMRLISFEKYKRIEGRAEGELQGVGVWTFREKDGRTLVEYDWRVNTTKRWMNWLAPVAKPLFAWNHDYVMESGRRGLKTRLQRRKAD